MLNCVVIGAGPGGLVCTKELLEQGVRDIVCLERTDQIGGTFATAYDNLELTSSAGFSMFSDFWVGDGNAHAFWSKDDAVDYYTRYAKHFGVLDHVRFGSEVTSVVPRDDQSWDVRLSSGETLQSRRLALAVGNNSIPAYPAWKDALGGVEYVHSKAYRNGDRFAGKRVLVVGGGESGADIALDVSRVASQCWVSLRSSAGWVVPRRSGQTAVDTSTNRGLWGLPREYGAAFSESLIAGEERQSSPVHQAVAKLNRMITVRNGIWGSFGTKTLGLTLAMANHGCEVVGDVVTVADHGRTLGTADQRTLTGVDAVIFCTGFKNHLSFMPDALQACDPRGLFKHMFHPLYGDRIAWIGFARPGFGSQFPIMEMQARLWALISTGQRRLPDRTERERITSSDRETFLRQFERNAQRVRSLVDYHRYMDDMARLIGCDPPLVRYLVRHPRLWLHIVYGPTQATQFRLRGPGKKVDLAHEILMKLPVTKLNHACRLGLGGRLRYALSTVASAITPGIAKSAPSAQRKA